MTTRREALQWITTGLSASLNAEDAALAEPAPDATPVILTDSAVGSLYPFIQSQVPKGEFPLSYLRQEFRDVKAWKRKGRAAFLELLEYAPPKCDPRPEVLEKTDRGDYLQEKVLFNTTPDLRIPAYVLIPKRATFPAPAIVALHDHGGFYFYGKEKLVESDDEHPTLTDFKRRYYAGKSVASELARQGYVVIVADMFYWGERRMILDGDPADWRDRPRNISPERVTTFNTRASQYEDLTGRTISAAGFTWTGVMLWDDIRTLDYLLTRPEVDKNRVGCVGLSVGGLRSCRLAAMDDRIKAAVVVGWMASFPAQLRSKILYTIGHSMLVPGMTRRFDYPDVAALAIPTALLVINGAKDTLFDLAGVRAAFDKLAACYAKAGVPERLRTRLYDTPHEFNAEMQAEAWEWLRKWL